jgi:hypothetical protein
MLSQFRSCKGTEAGEREWSESSAVDWLWSREIVKEGPNKSRTRYYCHGTRNTWQYVGYEVLASVTMKIMISWDIMPCSPVEVHRRFGGSKNKTSEKPVKQDFKHRHSPCPLIYLSFYSEDGSRTFLLNRSELPPNYMTSHLRRQHL